MTISLLSQIWPPASKFNESDIPDLSGKIVCVTGSNCGIGKETARALLARGARVYLACRSEVKALAAIEELKTVTGKDDVHFLKLDLGDIKASKAAAEELIRKEAKLHLLFNNAGVAVKDSSQKTLDGYELQWGTNVLGPFVFTETLLPILKAAVPSSPVDSVRIITTSAASYIFTPLGGVNLEDQSFGGKGGMMAQYQSKIGNIFISQYWSEKLKPDGIVSVSLSPGAIVSEGTRNFSRIFTWFFHTFLAYPTAKGALTQLYAGTSPEVTLAQSGAFFVPWARIDYPDREDLRDEVIKSKVIALIKEQVASKL